LQLPLDEILPMRQYFAHSSGQDSVCSLLPAESSAMNISVGKPVLALLSAACIAVPGGTADASAATGPSVPTASITSTTSSFDPLPPALRSTAATASIDGATLLALLTFPYHNVYGVTVAVGNAAAAGLQVVLLPLSVASLVGSNQTEQVPAYIQSTFANAAAAIPGIFQAIQAEIQYDLNLFSQLGAGGSMLRAADTNGVSAVSAGGANLLALLTFPYHNVYGVTVAVGNAAAAALQVVLLPLSVASLVGSNQTEQVPAYIQSTIDNAAAAIPGIFKAIQAEIEYDRNLFSQLGGGSTATVAAATETAPRLMTATIAPTADAAADTTTPEPNETKTDAVAEKPSAGGKDAKDATADSAQVSAEKSAIGDGDEADSENAPSTPKSVKRPPKTTTDVSSTAGHDATVDKSETTGSDSGSSVSTSSAADTKKAAPNEKSDAASSQSEK
jgi:hypothetical protein